MNLNKNLISKSSKIKVGITIGDPSGIGPGITLKAIAKLNGVAEFTVIGDGWVLKQAGRLKRHQSNFKLVDLENINRKTFEFGKVSAEYGRASVEYLDRALDLIKKKEIDCMVTCPVSKEAVNIAGINFSGHTEYLALATNTRNFAMLLLNRSLIFSLITRHIPLKSVSSEITKDKIYNSIVLTHAFLKNSLSISNPRLVICGLNPHASDNGIIGPEENKTIKPVLEKLSLEKKMRIDGPYSADSAVLKTFEKVYDCCIAMYHDQALIPLKLTDSQSGVNITLGLPFIRTSPLHGTAFDIAGDYAALNPNSLIAAINLAVKCTLNQKNG